MLKMLIPATVAFGLVAATACGAWASEKESIEDMQMSLSECHSLIKEFDAAATSNKAAITLRNKAENNCADAARSAHLTGVDQIKQALKMIGSKAG